MSHRNEPLTPRLDFLFAVVRQAKEQEEAWLPGLRAEIASWVAYQVAYGEKFEIHHDHDPPWDQSGDLRQVAGGFSAQDHETLGDFLSEPSGEKQPSYERGAGWFFVDYGYKIEEIIRDFIWEQILEVARGVVRDRAIDLDLVLWDTPQETPPGVPSGDEALTEQQLWDCDQSVNEPIGEYVAFDLGLRWREEAEAWPLAALLEEGALKAQRRRLEEEVVQAEQRRVAAERAVRSRAIFALFVVDFESRIGPFPRHHQFTKKDPFWPKLQRLLLDRWTAEERDLLADHLSGSNSVEGFLKKSR